MSGIVRVQSTQVAVDNTQDPSFNAGSPFTQGSKGFLIMSVFQGSPLVSATIGGKLATLDNTVDIGTGDVGYLYRADNLNGGTMLVSVNSGGGNNIYVIGAILEYTGLIAGGPDKIATNSGTNSGPTSTTGVTTYKDELVLSCWCNGTDSNGAAAPSGYTAEYSSIGSEGGSGASRIISATGAQTALFAVTGAASVHWGALIATYKAAIANSLFFGSGTTQ